MVITRDEKASGSLCTNDSKSREVGGVI